MLYRSLCRSLLTVAICLFALFLGAESSMAKAKYRFKVASLAPEGSIWITKFKAFGDEVSAKSNGEIGFRIYPGGIMGDDQAMYRKMRVGQLQGGGFTMSGIASKVPDFRVMAIPFLFSSYEEIDYVRQGMEPFFAEKFAEQGLKYLSFTEVGFVYAMSKNRIDTFDELQKSKNWTPAGDLLSTGFLQTAGISPTQLSLPDVLSALQTGMVDTVYNSLYGSIVLQWFTSINYINTVPSGYAYGVILLDGKKFNKMPKKYQQLVEETAKKYFTPLIAQTRQSNQDSREVLKNKGIGFIAPASSMVEKLSSYQAEVIKKSTGKLFSAEALEKMNKLRQEFKEQSN